MKSFDLCGLRKPKKPVTKSPQFHTPWEPLSPAPPQATADLPPVAAVKSALTGGTVRAVCTFVGWLLSLGTRVLRFACTSGLFCFWLCTSPRDESRICLPSHLFIHAAFVYQRATAKRRRPGGLNERDLSSRTSGSCKSKTQGWAESIVSKRGSVLLLWLLV